MAYKLNQSKKIKKQKMNWIKTDNKEYKCGKFLIKSDKKGGYNAYYNGDFIGWALTLMQTKTDCYFAMIGVR